jgi:glycine cleavage system H protein
LIRAPGTVGFHARERETTMANRPTDARYAKTHEWVRVQGTTATVGITDFAVEHLGDLVYVDLPQKGKKVGKGETLAEVESVKAVGEVYSPVSGEVLETNAGLANDQSPLSKEPFTAGWLVKLKVPAGTKVEDLMDLPAYEKHLETASTES